MTAMPQPAARGSLSALFLVVLTGMIGFGIFIPIFPFLALHLGASATETTLAMGAYSLGQLLGAPGWGRLSDAAGRRSVLIIGLIGAAISYIMLAHATNVEMMGLARLFGGLMAGNVGAAFAAATDLADDRTRARNMGLLGAAFALGFIFGPAIGAALAGPEPTHESFARVCYAAAAFAALAALGALLFFQETLPKHLRRSSDMPRIRRSALLKAQPLLARLVATTVLMIAAQALLETTFGLWADKELRWGPQETGYAFAALGVMTVLMQGGATGRLARVLGERRMLIIGLCIFAAGFVATALAGNWPQTIFALALLAIGGGMASPALTSLIGAQTTNADRGAIMGLNQSAGALGRVIGPLFAGAIFDGLGHTAPFLIGAGVLMLALALAVFGARSSQT
ncbi:MAG: MFS transporter [Hyphomonadaceae bacterium]